MFYSSDVLLLSLSFRPPTHSQEEEDEEEEEEFRTTEELFPGSDEPCDDCNDRLCVIISL